MHLKILSAKLRPSCPGGDELSIGGCLIWNVCTGGSWRWAAWDLESEPSCEIHGLMYVKSCHLFVAENEVQPQSSIVIDHPLAPDTGSLSPMADVDNPPSLRDCQNNSLALGKEPRKAGNHGQCLLLSDHDRIRIFIQEFLTRGLLPWAERTLRTLNDQVKEQVRSLWGLLVWWHRLALRYQV